MLDKAAVAPRLSGLLLHEDASIAAASLAAIRRLDVDVEEATLVRLALSDAEDPLRLEALNTVAARRSPRLQEVAEHALATGGTALRIRGLEVLVASKAPRQWPRWFES